MIGAVVRAQLDNLKVNEQEGDFVGYSKQEASTQKSGLWRLPYIDDLLLPHNIDVMHTEKNWVEALFGTIMDIPDKMKDNVKARLDLATLCDKPRYEMKAPERGIKWKKTRADYVLTRAQKKEALEWIQSYNSPKNH